jgi:hypothetical protein
MSKRVGMNESLSAAGATLQQAGEVLAATGSRLGTLDPGAAAFGGDGPGVLGDLGRDLHHQWQSALDARAREAAAHGARLDDAAHVVSRASASYADTDDTARGRAPEVP